MYVLMNTDRPTGCGFAGQSVEQQSGPNEHAAATATDG